MKESYRENLASCSGLEPYAGDGDIAGVASARGNTGRPLSSEIITFACRSCSDMEKAISSPPIFGEAATDAAESENPCMCGHSKRENREILLVSDGQRVILAAGAERSENVSDGNADMNANRKSDESVVPATTANNGADEATRLWLRVIRRRSQRGRRRWTWARMQRLARRHLPRPRIVHPYPDKRFRARLKAGAV